MARQVIRPDGVGRYNEVWQPNNGAPYWANLDEVDQDGDVTYIWADEPAIFTVTFNDTSFGSHVQPTRVASATLIATIRRDGALPTKFKFRLRHLGIDYDTEEYTTTSASYVEVFHTYHQLPNGSAWNASAFKDIEAGLVYVEGSALRCTKLELQVHTEPFANQTMLPSDVNPSFQDWHNFPGTASAHLSVGAFDGGGSYLYSNTLWSVLEYAGISNLQGVWGFAADDAFAVGEQGTILYWDGSTWTQQTSGVSETLYGVWGTSNTDMFVVGTGGTILHWDGVSWTPQVSGTSFALRGVWGTATNNVFAVGASGTVLYWNGAVWASMVSSTVESLFDIWGFDASNIYACGSDGEVIFFNGGAWASITTGSIRDIHSVWGSSATDVVVVGDAGVIFQWNGAVWSTHTSGTTINLRGVWGASLTEIIVVGESGLALRWDGSTWQEQPTYRTEDLNDVWGTIATNVFVVGNVGLSLRYEETAWEPLSIFEMSNFFTPTNPPNIDRVQVSALVQNRGDQAAECAVVLRAGGNNYNGAHGTEGWAVPADGKWHLIEEEFLNDPSIAWPSGAPGWSPWNSAQVDLAEVGVLNLGGNLRCTTISLETFQLHTGLTAFDAFPASDGYRQDYDVAVPVQPVGSNWQNVDEDPPDYSTSYLGSNAAVAGDTQYGTFGPLPAITSFPAGEQAYFVEVRNTVRLGTTTTALVAPVIRSNNETYVGRTFPISNTGTNWFSFQQKYFTSPFTGLAWSAAEIDAAEFGMVTLEGDAWLTQVRVHTETAPLLSGTPDPLDLQMTDLAVDPVTGIITRSTSEGIIYAVTEFAIGTGGYTPTTPTAVVPVNPADTALANEIYRGRISHLTSDIDNYPADPWEVTYWCRVPREEAIEGIGEVGLFAEILWSPVPAEIGTKFLFALMHMPCQCRHSRTVHLYRLTIEYP
jgi:hypothetical protein